MQYPLVSDMDRKVFAEELAPRLPKKLFDAHVHVFNKDCFPEGFSLGEKSCYQKFGGEHRSEFCVEMYKKLLPGIDVTFNCFGSVNPAADREKDIPYHDNKKIYSMAVVSPLDSAETLERRLVDYKLVGVKPYPGLAGAAYGKKESDVEVREMFTDEQLEVLNRRKMIATVHIPRKQRLADHTPSTISRTTASSSVPTRRSRGCTASPWKSTTNTPISWRRTTVSARPSTTRRPPANSRRSTTSSCGPSSTAD